MKKSNKPSFGQSILIGVVISSSLLALIVALTSLGPVILGDISLYAKYAHLLASGHMPYSSGFHLEYPPGIIPLVWLASVLGKLGGSYVLGFMALSTLAVGIFLGHRHYKGGWRGLLLASVLLLPLLRFIFYELDVFAALALYGAIYQLTRQKYNWSAALLALSILIKAYPGVCLLGLIWVVPRSRRRRYLSIIMAVFLLVFLPLAVIEPRGLWYALTYHAGRPIEFEASGAVIGFMMHALGKSTEVVYTHKSLALIFPGEPVINMLSSIVLSLGLLWGSVMVWRGRLQAKPALLSLIFLLFYTLCFKVGSPQYLALALFIVPLASGELSPSAYKRLFGRFVILASVVWLFFIILAFGGGTAPGSVAWLVVALSIMRVILLVELITFLGRRLWRVSPQTAKPLENMPRR